MEINHELLRKETEFGLKNSNWLSAMRNFSSAKVYEARVYDFFEYQLEFGDDFIQNLIIYWSYVETNSDNLGCRRRSYLTTTQRAYRT
jgi:hypothetical protein